MNKTKDEKNIELNELLFPEEYTIFFWILPTSCLRKIYLNLHISWNAFLSIEAWFFLMLYVESKTVSRSWAPFFCLFRNKALCRLSLRTWEFLRTISVTLLYISALTKMLSISNNLPCVNVLESLKCCLFSNAFHSKSKKS